jgi:hypothetical protein
MMVSFDIGINKYLSAILSILKKWAVNIKSVGQLIMACISDGICRCPLIDGNTPLGDPRF